MTATRTAIDLFDPWGTCIQADLVITTNSEEITGAHIERNGVVLSTQVGATDAQLEQILREIEEEQLA